MTVREAEHDAARLLESSWWITPASDAPLPVDPMELAGALGIWVRIVPLPPDESGSIDMPVDGPVVISLNLRDSLNRQRFTCAHEIGHYRRRRSQRGSKSQHFVDYRDTLAGLGIDADEIYANQFAAALLMPAHLVQRGYVNGHESVEDLARRFGTSTQAMRVRLRNLRLA